MPIDAGPNLNLARAFLFGLAALVLGIGLVFVVIQLAGSGDIDVQLGDDVFNAGPADNRAEEVAEDGPILFSSLSRERPIFVQHLGDDPAEGWVAVDARSPSDPSSCALSWDPAAEVFVDDCDPGTTYPADGSGLLRYDITVDDDGDLVVSFAGAEPTAP